MLNVMIKCNCINADNREIRWYSASNGKDITVNHAEPQDTPYVMKESGTLVFPIFNDLYQGIYYCGVGKDLMFAANINLTLWTGNYV